LRDRRDGLRITDCQEFPSGRAHVRKQNKKIKKERKTFSLGTFIPPGGGPKGKQRHMQKEVTRLGFFFIYLFILISKLPIRHEVQHFKIFLVTYKN
jgi:hypothetical protein